MYEKIKAILESVGIYDFESENLEIDSLQLISILVFESFLNFFEKNFGEDKRFILYIAVGCSYRRVKGIAEDCRKEDLNSICMIKYIWGGN